MQRINMKNTLLNKTFVSQFVSPHFRRFGSSLKIGRNGRAFTPASVLAGCAQLFCLLAVAGFLTGCMSSTTMVYRNPNFDQSKSYRVAVFPFRDAAGCPGSGETLSSIFETTLLGSGKVEVVERGELDRIMRERHPEKLGATSRDGGSLVITEDYKTNSASVSIRQEHPDYGSEFEDPVTVGKLLRADLVIVGKVTNWTQASHKWGGQHKSVAGASIKAISVQKGVVVWSLDKSTEATLLTDAIPIDAPVDVVGRKLCRQMVASFVGKP